MRMKKSTICKTYFYKYYEVNLNQSSNSNHFPGELKIKTFSIYKNRKIRNQCSYYLEKARIDEF